MRVGILGGGQLARMLALAGHSLGLEMVVLSSAPDDCAAGVAERISGRFDDPSALGVLAERVDVVTYEVESVPAQSIEFLSARVPVLPPASALVAAHDRLPEKRLFSDLGIPVPAFAAANDLGELERAVASVGLPAVVKTRTGGYDGKGQAVLHRHSDVPSAWTALGRVPVIVEALVPFVREVAITAVRGRDGTTAFYPLVTNTHRDGILRLSVCCPDDPLQALAREYSRRLADSLQYVGALTLELFEHQGTLWANEFAPRVHNSGHWTIEGAETSQFENHLRAITGLPLGGTAPVSACAMVNIIGDLPDVARVLAVPGAHLHVYRKQPRAGRKIGHVTVRATDRPTLQARLEQLSSALFPSADDATPADIVRHAGASPALEDIPGL